MKKMQVLRSQEILLCARQEVLTTQYRVWKWSRMFANHLQDSACKGAYGVGL